MTRLSTIKLRQCSTEAHHNTHNIIILYYENYHSCIFKIITHAFFFSYLSTIELFIDSSFIYTPKLYKYHCERMLL